ncbi:MAG: hypothetical protein A2Y07_08570 [Planctomycetes bacterium GWF2_50_10]|nr:MAG: hypothetical protein A2Y07_08570 [Planctomycetes bacterium GWF2_50_10]
MSLKNRFLLFKGMILCLSMHCLVQLEPAQAQLTPDVWQIYLDAENFKPVLQETKEEALDSQVIGVVSNRKSVEHAKSSFVYKCGEGAAFEVFNQVPDRKTMKWVLTLKPQDTNSFQYYKLRYKAKGLYREYNNFSVVSLSGKDASGNVISEKLIDCSQIVNDGQWHVLIGKKHIGFTADNLEIEINTIDSIGSFAIDSLIFSDQVPDERRSSDKLGSDNIESARAQFAHIDLESLFNDTYSNAINRVLEKHTIAVDSCNVFGSEHLLLHGIPFKVKAEGNNIVTSPEDTSINQGQVEFAGCQVPKKYFFPESRDDLISLKVDKKVSEAFLVLVSEFPAKAGRYGLPDAPVFFDDVEMFSVELVYDDGESDLAFPYSLADHGYIIRRAVGIYAVPVDENRMLKSIIFHNRFFGATVNIAAVTLNTSQVRIIPPLVAEPELTRVPMLPEPPFKQAYIKQDGDLIKCGNSYFDLVINCRNGLAIEKLVNRWSASTSQVLDANSGLKLNVANHILTGQDFAVEKIDIQTLKANIELKSKIDSVPLKLTIRFTVDETSQLIMRLTAKNTSTNLIKPKIKFPYLENIQIGTLKNTWVCFPQYRNVISNQEGFHIASNDHAFPMQFYDVYNPEVGIGLAVVTHNLNHSPIDYSVQKNTNGVSAFIQYPEEFYNIEAGQTIEFPETAIVSHNGDWRQAADSYQAWVKTWYKPNTSSQRNWFNKISLVKDYFLHETVSLRDLKVPSMYSKKAGEFRIKKYLELDKDYWGGLTPDVIHFFHWSYLDADKDGNKEYGEYDYDYFGGLDKFKSALNTIQKDFNAPVSLYMAPDRCSTGTETGKRIGEKAVKLRADESKLVNETTWYVCPQQKDWLDDFVKKAKKVQSETNADIMYFDVVGFWRTNTCYSKEHGHPVPSWYNQATYDLVKHLREALPPHVAIWTEYPLTDLNTQFTDGNIAYYYLTLYELWTKSHDTIERAEMYSDPSTNLFRFIFPNVKQIDLPIGNESAANGVNRLKFTFFNGDAIYDNGWLSMATRTRKELMIKSMSIKKQFSDCFYSANITPLVPTERAKVYANKFAGNRQTVYTLYNGRYTTIRGPVLAIEHKDGASYYDLWNEKSILPKIVNGRAIIDQKLGPQALGCIVQYERNK